MFPLSSLASVALRALSSVLARSSPAAKLPPPLASCATVKGASLSTWLREHNKVKLQTGSNPTHTDWRHEFTMMRIDQIGEHKRKRQPKKNPLGEDTPFARGIILKTLVKKPKKPNSANRKCVHVRLAKSGREIKAYVPGEGHTLQEHQTVLLHVRRSKDIGLKARCIRGKYDLAHVVKKTQ